MVIMCSQAHQPLLSITDIFTDQGFHLVVVVVVVVVVSESAGFVFIKSEDQTAHLPGCIPAPPTLCFALCLGLWTFWV